MVDRVDSGGRWFESDRGLQKDLRPGDRPAVPHPEDVDLTLLGYPGGLCLRGERIGWMQLDEEGQAVAACYAWEDATMAHEEALVGTVRGLYRYPIKSTAGEKLHTAQVTAGGLQHDRKWAR